MAAERSVSVLGLGVMGSAIARVFVKNGWKTTIWNRSSTKVKPLVTFGAVAASSVVECVRASPLVITCLLGPQAFREVLEAVDPESCAGRIVVDFSSGTPSQIQNSHRLASKMSFANYIRGSIMTTPAHIGRAESPFYYSGNESAYRSIEPALRMLGRASFLGNDPASATIHECVLGNCFFGLMAGFLQAMALLKSSSLYEAGGAERLTSETLGPLLTHGFSEVLQDLAKQIDHNDYITPGGDGAPLRLLVKSLGVLNQVHLEQGLSSELIRPLLELMEVRMSHGGAEEEMSSLVETISNATQRDGVLPPRKG